MLTFTSAKHAAQIRRMMANATQTWLMPHSRRGGMMIGSVWLWIIVGAVWLAWFAVRLAAWALTETILLVVLLAVLVDGVITTAMHGHHHNHEAITEALLRQQ